MKKYKKETKINKSEKVPKLRKIQKMIKNEKFQRNKIIFVVLPFQPHTHASLAHKLYTAHNIKKKVEKNIRRVI